jgi:hypothetical protein
VPPIRAANSFYQALTLTGGKAIEVMLDFRVAVLRSCSSSENVFDALGRKVELNESDAAIEGFAVMRDQPIPKTKAAHAFEEDGAPGRFWQE